MSSAEVATPAEDCEPYWIATVSWVDARLGSEDILQRRVFKLHPLVLEDICQCPNVRKEDYESLALLPGWCQFAESVRGQRARSFS